jgi:CMP-N,N'-diacetyllegionaminic acid synthase
MIGRHSVLAVVPARGGSKAVPGKNILPIAGRPLLQWTVEAAAASKYIDRLIVSSDDEQIIEVATRLGCEAPFTREAALSGDEASSIDVVVDAVTRVPGFAIVVLLQPTSPLRITADIDGVLELLEARSAPACVSVRPAQEHPYLTFELDADEQLRHFVPPPANASLRRQDLPPAWCLNGAVYAARVDWLVRERTFLSAHTVGYPMSPERSLDIDTPADIELFKQMLARSYRHE